MARKDTHQQLTCLFNLGSFFHARPQSGLFFFIKSASLTKIGIWLWQSLRVLLDPKQKKKTLNHWPAHQVTYIHRVLSEVAIWLLCSAEYQAKMPSSLT